MPIYDYRCDHCGHAFSAVRSFTDDAIEKCPACGKRPRKLPASLSIVFKGSGWYKTDSRGTAKAGVGDGDLEAKPAAEAKGTGATIAEAKGAEAKVEGKGAEAKVEGKGAEAKGDGRRADAKRDAKAADARPAKPAAPPKEAAS